MELIFVYCIDSFGFRYCLLEYCIQKNKLKSLKVAKSKDDYVLVDDCSVVVVVLVMASMVVSVMLCVMLYVILCVMLSVMMYVMLCMMLV